MSDRGVSEVVSFVLVFSLIALTVGIVYVGGVGSLENARDAERVDNAVKAFDVLDDNIDDIVRSGAPSRATELKLSNADLRFGNETSINVTTDVGGTQRFQRVSLAPIIYEASDTKLVYEAGAVIRSDPGGSVMLNDPPLLFDSQRTAIPLVQTRMAGDLSATGGTGTVLVRTDAAGNGPDSYAKDSLFALETGMRTVTLNVTTDRPDVWEGYLEAELTDAGVDITSDPCTVDGRQVSCTFETEGLYVSVTRIDVTFN